MNTTPDRDRQSPTPANGSRAHRATSRLGEQRLERALVDETTQVRRRRNGGHQPEAAPETPNSSCTSAPASRAVPTRRNSTHQNTKKVTLFRAMKVIDSKNEPRSAVAFEVRPK